MTNTSTSSGSPLQQVAPSPSSVVAREAAHFGGMAADWWDPDGASAMLHKLNPVRLCYIRDRVDQHWSLDEQAFRPLLGKTALDVGCGAGLLAEPLARMGAAVTGIDAAPSLIDAARQHAEAQGLTIDYRAVPIEEVGGSFDLITAMEVVEHVADPTSFVRALAARLSPDGLLIMSTPNRTAWARLLTITLAEGTGRIPRGTHDYDQFIPPDRMKEMLAAAGLNVCDLKGIAFGVARGLHLSEDLRLNYLLAARHRQLAG